MTIEEAKIAFIEKRASGANQTPIRFCWTRLRLTRAQLRTPDPGNTSGILLAVFADLSRPVLDLRCLHGSR